VPWSLLPDKTEKFVEEMFFYSIFVQLGDGANTLFWKDRWIQGRCIAEIAPCLIKAVGPRIQNARTVKDALQNRKWMRDIRGALTVQVILEYPSIWEITEED
jgi:hypothetical protein